MPDQTVHIEQETTTISEIYRRCFEGTFYQDYDWATGPALRCLRELSEKEESESITKMIPPEKYSADWVKQQFIEGGFDWLDHHICSICGGMTGYFTVEIHVFFQSSCKCSGSEPRYSSFQDISKWLLMQPTDEVRDKIMTGLKAT